MFKRLMHSRALRRRVSWIMAAAIFLPLIIFFAPGLDPLRRSGKSAGMLFGKPVSWDRFREQHELLRRNVEAQFGPVPANAHPLLIQMTWERLLLLAEAQRLGMEIPDQEVLTVLQDDSTFHDQGRFSRERYRRMLARSGLSPGAYERRLREQLVIQKLVETVRGSVSVTDTDIRSAYEERHERRSATVAFFDPSSFRAQAEAAVTDQDARADYEAHPEAVRVPEQIAVEYLGTSLAELMAQVSVDDREVETFYHDHPEPFQTEDGQTRPLAEVRELARQHLIEERARRQLNALALDLHEEVEAQRTFEEIATARALSSRSIGPVSVGTLWMPQGQDPALLQEAAKLAEGQRSGVIESDGGVYIARVTKRVPAIVPPFEEVRDPIRQRLVQARARQAAKAAAEALHKQLDEKRNAGWRFEEAALALGPMPASSATFSRTEPIGLIGYSETATHAAFQTPLGHVSDVIEAPTGFAFLRPETHLPADPAGFAEAEATLREQTLTQKQATHFQQWLTDLRARAKLQSFVEPVALSKSYVATPSEAGMNRSSRRRNKTRPSRTAR